MDRPLDYKKIGARIKDARTRRKMTRERLAEAIGISSMYLGQLERGERRGGINNYVEIANVLELSLDYLFFDELLTDDVLNRRVLREIGGFLSQLTPEQKSLFFAIVSDIAKRMAES